MKKFLTAVAMALLLVGCTREAVDLSGINEKLAELDNRVSALEGAIASIQSAIGDGVFVQKVEQYADPETGKTIGVTVTYTSGKVVYFEISPKADYAGPVLGVIRSGSGSLVWAVDGIAIKDGEGNEVPVNKTPVFTIDEEGYLWVSIDGGDPVKLGQVKSEGASLKDGIFKDIKVEQDKVVLVLSDDSIVNIPFAEAFKLVIEGTEFLNDGKAITIPYTVTAKTANTVVDVTGYDPTSFYVEVTDENIIITPLMSWVSTKMLIYADSKVGLTSMVSIEISPECARVIDPRVDGDVYANYVVESEGGTIEMHVVSNVEIEAKVLDDCDWITIVSTKSKTYTITAAIAENTGMARFGYVAIYKKGTDKQLQTIDIYQAKTSAVTNLSKKGTANSYIITKPGDFKFKAVKGNSAESVGTVAKAEVLWETFNSTQEVEAKSIIAAVGFEGDYITFSTPDNLMAGNALIAAKDATGIILWSWHIWIPETEIATSDFGLGGQTFMDRNLGALKVAVASTTELVDVTSQGLLYSWGRKDPFLAPSTVGGSEMAKSTGTFDMTGAQMTPAESVAKPTTFVSTGSDDVPCWTNPKDDTLWGTEKTLYDPCPPGYKVADFTDKGIWTLASGTTSTLGFSKNLDYKWFKFGDDPCAVFPIVGYFDASPNPAKYANTGKRAYVLSSKASGGYDSVIRVDKDNNKTTSERPARAGSVRCVVDASAVPPATDLSENGTANSYIVSEAGDYKFKAVQGNSTTSVGTIAKAEIVWETNNTATAPEANAIIAKVGVDEGYITFSTPATLVPGNALIAAKDAEGKILWSWHIWIPKTAIKEDTYGLGEVKMMSRALGALVDAEGTDSAKPDITSVGLMYQWGRKDPFMNAGSFFSSTGAHGAATAPADVFKTSATAGATIAYSIENPTEYIKGADDSNTWCSETTDANWAAAKTIYDPCPPGYRVPQSSEVLLLNKAKADIPGWDSSHKAYNWFVCGNPTTQFANAGFIEETGLDHYRSVERVIIWSSTVYTDSKRARCALYNDGSVSADTKQAQARGGIVRCVVDAPAAE